MVRNVYAFLVGIDQYPSPLSPLRGCINDIEAFEQYLHGWVRDNSGYVLQPPHRLVNQQATRQAIIEGFRTYLSQAQSSDVALFYYSGHGSQAPSPPEFWAIEPDRFNETLVCWDSRLEGQWDLADKELAALIAEVAQADPHIIVILDCCHSGTGTRKTLQSVATRQVPADTRQRPFDTFLLTSADLSTLAAARSAHPAATQGQFSRGRHVLLAACREHEEAREFFGGGTHRGAFSYFLLETLKQTSGPLTYRDLFRRTQARVQSQVAAQSPQLEATHAADLDQPFLGGAIARSHVYYTVSYSADHGWIINSGSVHGIPIPSADEWPQIAIFPFHIASDLLKDAGGAIAQAEIVAVFPQLSQLRITHGSEHLTDTQAVFKAVLTAVPLPATTVSLDGDADAVQLIRQALQTASPNGQPSPYLREPATTELTQIRVLAQDNTYSILRPADAAPLVSPLQGYTLDQAAKTVHQLEQLARWMTVADLAPPTISQIPADALRIQIYRGNQAEPLTQPQIRLAYEWDASRKQWQQPTFRIKLSNQSDLTLFCALYDLTETFQITSLLIGGTVRLNPREEVWVAQGQPIYGNVSKVLWQQGVTEFCDILKAIACTADFDATLLEQDELGHPLKRSLTQSQTRGGTLNRLMQRVMTRHLSLTPATEDTIYDDWMTSQITFTIVRPQPTAPIDAAQAIDLGQGVTLKPHPSLRGTACLTTATATRNLHQPGLPPLLLADPQVSQPLQFATSRNVKSDLNVLELKNVINAETVTPAQPLTLVAPIALQPHEYVLPIAFDGEFFLPLGRGQAHGNQTEIYLERLPNPIGEGTRSLGGSIRIFFQKVVAQKLGLEFPYPILAAVGKGIEETLCYEADRSSVAQKISAAQTILLLLHGIAGDTQSMVLGVRQAQGEEGQSLLSLYDLVLTFDYENLNTSISDLAKQLKDRLATVGLTPNHGKTLHVIAHSLGGLVARCFIEQQDGHQVVQHLIMLGTPNAGSPWPTLQDWATAALTIGLNSLSSVALPVKALGSLMAVIELVDVTLDQMKPGSDFLKSLADSTDPGIPYTVIAGNASLIPLPNMATRNQVIRLLDRVGRTVVEFPFMSQSNDLAATVYSIRSLPPQRSPIPRSMEVACHHFSYLTDAAALETLSQALVETNLLSHRAYSGNTPQPNQNHPDRNLNRHIKFWLVGLLVISGFSAALGIWLFHKQSNNPNSSIPTIALR
ncbi:caspase family protein [Pseudanabaena sp. FACHB-2040]|uniref:caspase family protein n=1 Tax=Pseudanabaena sp. FACHB-2040 TaxID=2692859 RepID=UPI0016853F6B|nr:caspase family protein [Pseudanabaena sp. FACHB-2040]MBD2259301.1 caspase family protein [Pseudanabaena sp. FACHB-2040]